MKSFITLLAAFALWTLPAAAAEPVVIQFSHVVAPDTPKGKGAARFKQLAEERTQGRVRIEVYPNSQLYKDKEEMEALQLGAVQMLAPTLSKFGPLGVPEFEVLDLPYIIPDEQVLRRVTQGPVGKRLFERLETKGIKGLAFWDNGFKLMSANRPLRKPEDFRGLKMRIQSSKVLDAQMRELGALPQVTAMAEAYSALMTGVVDGTENVWSNMSTLKMHEVQKHATLSDHGYIGYAVIVNKRFWEALPDGIRATLEGAMADTTAYVNEIARQENEQALAAMRASGRTEFHTLSPEEKAVWRRALLPVHQKMAGRVGQDLIDAIYREAAAAGYSY